MAGPLTLAIPSKGRLMEDTLGLFADAGLAISKPGNDRGYRGTMAGLGDVEVAFLSASEIARHLRDGTVDLGVTGEDLLRETIPDLARHARVVARLGFGGADVVVAVPECWIDVSTMSDLDEVSVHFYQAHDHRLRIATKYFNLTRRFFAEKGVRGYRIVESLGATEAAPAASAAEAIVDITSTGDTLRANHMRILDDGLILKSEAVLARAVGVDADPAKARLADTILDGIAD